MQHVSDWKNLHSATLTNQINLNTRSIMLHNFMEHQSYDYFEQMFELKNVCSITNHSYCVPDYDISSE